MMDFTTDNSMELKGYKISYRSDAVINLLLDKEEIRYSFYNDEKKVFLTDRRIIIEETAEQSQYSFVGLKMLDYYQAETKEVSRRASKVALILGFRWGTKLELIIDDEVDLVSLQVLLATNSLA